MKRVAVVIPTYSEKLAKHEIISLQQLCKVLGIYDKIFIAPEGLKIDYGDFASEIRVKYFPKAFFKSTITYSQLLLSEDFYACFAEYEYILIHQLDVFVFKDRLMEFCQLGYDYIGAPALKYVPLWHFIDARVGNGGLSLRKVASCIRLLSNNSEFIMNHPCKNDFIKYEDTFWGYAGTQPEMNFKVPDVRTARRFSLQDEVQHALRGPAIKLPFGVHAWQKINTGLWGKIIHEYYGYDTQDIKGENVDYRRIFVISFILVRKIINPNYLFGLIRSRKPKKALAYFLDWQEKAVKPEENPDLDLVVSFLHRLAQYCRLVQSKEENKLPYKLLEEGLSSVANEWKQ